MLGNFLSHNRLLHCIVWCDKCLDDVVDFHQKYILYIFSQIGLEKNCMLFSFDGPLFQFHLARRVFFLPLQNRYCNGNACGRLCVKILITKATLNTAKRWTLAYKPKSIGSICRVVLSIHSNCSTWHESYEWIHACCISYIWKSCMSSGLKALRAHICILWGNIYKYAIYR